MLSNINRKDKGHKNSLLNFSKISMNASMELIDKSVNFT